MGVKSQILCPRGLWMIPNQVKVRNGTRWYVMYHHVPLRTTTYQRLITRGEVLEPLKRGSRDRGGSGQHGQERETQE